MRLSRLTDLARDAQDQLAAIVRELAEVDAGGVVERRAD